MRTNSLTPSPTRRLGRAASLTLSSLLILAVPTIALAADVDVSGYQLNFGADDGEEQTYVIGEEAEVDFTHTYNNVHVNDLTIDAVVTVFEIDNIDSDDRQGNGANNQLDAFDDSSSSGREIDLYFDVYGDSSIPPDPETGYLTYRIDFFDGDSGEPLSLDGLKIGVSDVDDNQFVEFYGATSYTLSNETELEVYNENPGVLTFVEPEGLDDNTDSPNFWVEVEFGELSFVVIRAGANQSGSVSLSFLFEGLEWNPATSTTYFEDELAVHDLYYDLNGASGDAPETQSSTAESAAVTIDDSTMDWEYGSCEFTGWNTRADGQGVPYEDGDVIYLSDDLTLWADWQCPYEIPSGDSLYVLDYDALGLFSLQADGQSSQIFGEFELYDAADELIDDPDIEAAYLDSGNRLIYFVENNSFGLYSMDFDSGEISFIAPVESIDDEISNIYDAYGLAKLDGQFILLLKVSGDDYYITDLDVETGAVSNFRAILGSEENDAYGLAVLESSGDIFVTTYGQEIAYLIDADPYEMDVYAEVYTNPNIDSDSYYLWDTAVDSDETIWFQAVYESDRDSKLFAYNPNDNEGAIFQGTVRQEGYEALDPASSWGVGVTLVLHEDEPAQGRSNSSTCESTGVFLTVTGGVADRTASSPIVYGSCGLTSGAPYSLTVEPMGSVGAKRMLGSGAIPSSGALERTTHLPVLDAGNYKVVLTSRSATGQVLTLTNHVSVSGDQKYGSISAESLQPHLK